MLLKKKEKAQSILKKILIIISIIVFLGIIILNLIFVSNTDNLGHISIEYVKFSQLFISILIAVVIMAISHYLNKIKLNKVAKITIMIILILIYVLVQIRWSNTTIGQPSGDQRIIYNMAKDYINENNESLYQSEYLSKCPQQRSLLVMYILIMKIVNSTDYVWLYLINILSNVLSVFALYLILNRLSEKYTVNKVLFGILTLTFIPIILLCNFIYGDFIGLAFILFSVYFIMEYVKKNKKAYAIISAVLAAIALMFRMQYIIFAIAILIYLILNLKKKSVFKELVLMIIYIIIILIPYKLVGDYVSNKLDLNKEAAIPTSAYLYMAIYDGERGAGWYSQVSMEIAQTDVENAKNYYPPILKERIRELATHPYDAIKFYKNKIASMWTDSAFQCIFYNLPVYLDGQPQELYDAAIQESEFYTNYFVNKGTVQIKIYMRAIVFLVFILAMLFLIKNRKDISNEVVLLITIFLGGFFFHILWEAKSRYIIPYFVILIPIASIRLNKNILKLPVIEKLKISKKQKNDNSN